MRTQIKICCLRSVEEARLAVLAGADAVGLIGASAMPSSARAIDDREVAAIAAAIPPPTATVLLTSEPTAVGIAELVRTAGTSAVQIAAYLAPHETERLRKLLPGTKLVQVIHVEDEKALELLERYASYVNAFLLDSGKPSLPTPVYGGTGRTHDWAVSAELVRRSPLPVFLAGGLSPENVGAALRTVAPFGVDLCSGVRTNGRLDRGKLEAFVAAVRNADAARTAPAPRADAGI